MASKNTRSVQPDVYFVNYDLRVDEKKALKKMIDEEPEKFFDWVEKEVDGGYSFTLKRDTYNECIGCFVRQTDEKGPNQGMILTGRSQTAFGALAGALYRHCVLFQGEWDKHRGQKGSTDDE